MSVINDCGFIAERKHESDSENDNDLDDEEESAQGVPTTSKKGKITLDLSTK